MSDIFATHQAGLESPATRLSQITPSDNEDLAFATRAVAVGADGYVRVTTVAGDTGSIFIPAGMPFPVRVKRIWASGTTATDIVGLA